MVIIKQITDMPTIYLNKVLMFEFICYNIETNLQTYSHITESGSLLTAEIISEQPCTREITTLNELIHQKGITTFQLSIYDGRKIKEAYRYNKLPN